MFLKNSIVIFSQWRILLDKDFSSDFHVYGLQRLPNALRFYVDGILIGQVIPPPGGFWELGQFSQNPGGPNIWANGTTMTPFDYPVSVLTIQVHFNQQDH